MSMNNETIVCNISTNVTCVSLTQTLHDENNGHYVSLCVKLIQDLMQKILITEGIETVCQPNEIKPNQSQLEWLYEILNEKKNLMGELLYTVSLPTKIDEPTNFFHLNLMSIKEIIKSIEAGKQIRGRHCVIMKEMKNMIKELDRNALEFSKPAEECPEVCYARNIDLKFKEYKEMLNYVLDCLFGEEVVGMRCLLHDLTVAAFDCPINSSNPYISSARYDIAQIEFLKKACIIEQDPYDPTKIKLLYNPMFD